jgi:hypothetical protein
VLSTALVTRRTECTGCIGCIQTRPRHGHWRSDWLSVLASEMSACILRSPAITVLEPCAHFSRATVQGGDICELGEEGNLGKRLCKVCGQGLCLDARPGAVRDDNMGTMKRSELS